MKWNQMMFVEVCLRRCVVTSSIVVPTAQLFKIQINSCILPIPKKNAEQQDWIDITKIREIYMGSKLSQRPKQTITRIIKMVKLTAMKKNPNHKF